METDKNCLKKISVFVSAFFISFNLVLPPFLSAELQDVIDSKDNENIFLYIGDLVTVKVHSLTRVAVGNPGFVDITTATPDEIVLIGRKVGETPIFIWDDTGKHRLVARVLADDLGLVSQRVASMIQASGIKGISYEKNYYEGKIVLTGSLSKDEKKRLDELLKNYGAQTINMVSDAGDLIEIDVQISELNKTLTEALGIDWIASAEDALRLKYLETLPNFDGGVDDWFKLGSFQRTTAIQATVNALIKEGKGRILSKPSIVVSNGEAASFNVGGEIPIRNTTTNVTGATQENVTFKSYGIDMTVTPEMRDGKIDIKMDLQIRDIDSANAVGNNVAFTTRMVNTKLLVDDGQLIIMAGLIKRNKSEQIKRIPFLSRIPIVGMLFKVYTTTSPNAELELVISLRPRIYGKHDSASDQHAKATSLKTMNNVKLSNEVLKGVTSKETSKAVDDVVLDEMDAKKKEKGKTAAKQKKEVKDKQKKSVAKQKESKKDTVVKGKKKTVVKKDQKAATAKVSDAAPDVSSAAGSASLSFSAKATMTDKADDAAFIAMENTNIPEPQNVLSDEEIVQIKDKFSEKIKKEMAETISYPYEAKEYGWEGTVTLDVTVLPDGNVKKVDISQSSGRAIFDKDAVNTAQILAPYDSYTPAKNLRELTVTVPIEYSIKTVLGNGSAPTK